MKATGKRNNILCLMTALALLLSLLSACAGRVVDPAADPLEANDNPGPGRSRYLVAVEDEPDTVDFQCTTIHYTVAQNVFDRLVEMESGEDGHITIQPSLAESWTASDDGMSYTFHLRKNIKFSNGSALTSSDVGYTLTRLLTHPDSCNRDIALMILGAEKLERGETSSLEGFFALDDQTFVLALEQPSEAFLACLSMPGASILDQETMVASDGRFGVDPACTVGTGSFILEAWTPGEGMLLRANPACWKGRPSCDGLDLRFMTDPEEVRMLFESGELDILDLDMLDNSMEYFMHGDIYAPYRHQVQQVGISYIALNEAIYPLNDINVRKALQLALNRSVLLDAVCGGRGSLENGIYPCGLYGYDPDLAEIPCDPEEAARLIAAAGLPEDYTLRVSVKSTYSRWEMTLLRLAVSMWEKVGIHAQIEVLDESEFMRQRKSGALECYTATWTADYNDPDNLIFTFFGSAENTQFRSLGYPREDIMERVRQARTITDPDARIREYRELERIVVQDDAAWIPLFSRQRYYVTSERLQGFRASWNGSVKNNYREMSITDTAP